MLNFFLTKSNQLFLIPEGLKFVLVTIIKHKRCQGWQWIKGQKIIEFSVIFAVIFMLCMHPD